MPGHPGMRAAKEYWPTTVRTVIISFATPEDAERFDELTDDEVVARLVVS